MEYILYRMGSFVGMHLPLPFARLLARIVGRIRYYFSSPALRNGITSNMRVVLAYRAQKRGIPCDGDDLRTFVREAYRNFALYLMEFFRIPLWTPATVRKNVEVEGLERLDRALAKGKGVIVLTGHIGNWELAGICASLLGYPVNAVALPFRSRRIAGIFIARRQMKGVKVILTGAGPKEILHVFRRNQLVAVLGDRLFTEKGYEVMFMGRKTLLPRGPATLAVKTGAPYLPGFLIRHGGGYRLVFEDFLEAPAELPEHDRIQMLLEKGAKVLEDYILAYPGQWLNFSPLWQETDGRPGTRIPESGS
jgi:Kdo2-lipid IVA lauroyltransferase/acyltransferase